MTAFSISRHGRGLTLALLASAAMAPGAWATQTCTPGPGTTTSNAADICSTDDAGDPGINAQGDFDTLQIGGAAPLTFSVPGIGVIFTGFEAFQKIGAGDVTLSGAAAGIHNWTVTQGKLIATSAANFNPAASVTVNAGTELVLNAAGVTLASLSNAGTVTMQAGTAILTSVGAYTGGGTINMDVRFNEVATPGAVNGTTHDHLAIAGAVSGTTQLSVTGITAVSDNPDPTTGNGIELVHATSGAAANAFRLANPVLQGGFQYLLRQVNLGGGQSGFFLQSTVREEVVGNAVALAAGRTTVRALAFADRGVEAAEGIGARIRAWMTVQGGVDQAGLSSGSRFNSNYWGVTGGIDSGFTPNIRVGVQAGYGQTDAKMKLDQGNPKLEGDTWFVQLYAQYVSGPWFADLSAGYASTDWDLIRVASATNVNDTIDGVIGKAGFGYRFTFDEPFTVTASAHILYDGSSCGDDCFLVNNREDTTDWAYRLALRFERPYDGGAIRPYIGVSFTDDFDNGQSVTNLQAAAMSDIHSALFGLNAGLNYDISPNQHFYFDAGLTRSFDTDVQGYQGQIGYRMTW